MSTTPNTELQQPSTGRAVWLVAQREITTRLRSKAFLISTGILLVIVLAGVVVGGLVSQPGGLFSPGDEPAAATQVAVVAESAAAFSGMQFDVTEVADRDAAVALVEAGTVDAAVVMSSDPANASPFSVIALEEAPSDVIQALSVSPAVEILDPQIDDYLMAYLVAFAFGMVFFISVMTFGTTTAQSVVEEKQTRIVEILLATVTARVLLAGKIVGMTLLAVGQVLAIVVVAFGGMLATGQNVLFNDLGVPVLWFSVLFIFGFVLVATLYAALASLVSRQEDIGSATSPVMVLVMLPFYLVIFMFSNPQMMQVLSYVPFSAPIAMPVRLYLGTAAWWEPLASLGVLAIAITLVLWFGARVYENSVMRTGARVKLRDAVRGQ